MYQPSLWENLEEGLDGILLRVTQELLLFYGWKICHNWGNSCMALASNIQTTKRMIWNTCHNGPLNLCQVPHPRDSTTGAGSKGTSYLWLFFDEIGDSGSMNVIWSSPRDSTLKRTNRWGAGVTGLYEDMTVTYGRRSHQHSFYPDYTMYLLYDIRAFLYIGEPQYFLVAHSEGCLYVTRLNLTKISSPKPHAHHENEMCRVLPIPLTS